MSTGVIAIVAVVLLWPGGAGARATALELCPGERLTGSEHTFPSQPIDAAPRSLQETIDAYLYAAYDGVIPPWVDLTHVARGAAVVDLSVRENLAPQALLRFEEIYPARWELAGYLACEAWAAARDLSLRGTP